MKIAIPVTGGQLSTHFGHSDAFAIVEADPETGVVLGQRMISAPPHQRGVLPGWLKDRGVDVVIAGGMGRRALGAFAGHGIEVVIGAQGSEPLEVARAYLDGSLGTGENVCDH